MTKIEQNYGFGWDRIFNKPRNHNKKKFETKHFKRSVAREMSFESLFNLRWDQLRFSNSRDHVTLEIKKMVKNFKNWQKTNQN